MGATSIRLVHDSSASDRVPSHQRFIETRSGRLVRLMRQVRDLSGRVPGGQVYTVHAEAVGDGPVVSLTLIERGYRGPAAA